LQKVNHAGFTRKIIYRNPKRYDEDGIELSGSDGDEHADVVEGMNPYQDVHIER
jgi:hypothetical protein